MRLAFAAAVLAACAHAPDLALRPDPAPPAGSTTEVVTTPDGESLLARHWAPVEATRALVVIVHGLKDHSARYAAFATRLASSGYSVYAFDLRGHGRSSGERVAPARWLDYVGDLDRFLTAVETREPGRPVFVLGHSMGGAIATAAAIAHEPRIAGLVLSAPALAIDAPPLLIAATRMAGALTPDAPALTLPNADFSSTPGAAAAIANDPMVHDHAGPASTAAGLVDGIRAIWASIDRLTMPILALHGTRDRLTAPAGSRLLIDTAAATDKTLRIYEGLWHDLLHEPRAAEVEADIVAWLDAHTGGAPVTPPARYTGTLAGTPRGWTQAVAIDAGIAFVADQVDFAGDLAFRLARPRPLGWHGALTARTVGEYKVASLAPVGAAVRFGGPYLGGVFGVASGASVITGWNFAIPATAWLELSVGPAHVTAGAELTYRVSGDPPRAAPLGSDALWAGVAMRYGGDRAYWPGASAGVGPMIAGGMVDLGGIRAWTVTVGIQLYGAD
jgi:alpha-beta hydrolase superfamily lysophospholipase